MHKHEQAEKILVFERAHATRDTGDSLPESIDFTDKGVLTEKVNFRDHVSVRDKEVGVAFATPKRRLSKDIEEYLAARRRRTRSLEILPVPQEGTLKADKQRILRGLGFSIDRNDSVGIFVEQVLKDSPAEKSQNIFTGDRIRMLTISFDNMKFEDAIAILALVTPYTIRLDLEREAATVDDATQTEAHTAQMIIAVPKRRSPSVNIEPPIRRRDRGCLSFEMLDAPKLVSPRLAENKRIEPSELDLEERRIIHIVRHTPSTDFKTHDRFVPRVESTSEGETYEIHRGVRQILEGGSTKKIHEFYDMRTSRAIQMPSPVPTPSSSTSTSTSDTSAPASPVKRISSIFTTDASIHVTEHIQVDCEQVTMPVSTPSPPPPEEETFIPIRIVEPPKFYIESVRSPSPEPLPPITIHMHVEPKRKVMERTPLPVPPPPKPMHSPPGFVEMRAKRIEAPKSPPPKMPIIERRVPPLPASALETDVPVQRAQEGEKLDSLYQQIRDNLNKVYEHTLESKKS
uniref:PDZ domain-containing protein n=1 Tax=Acrobeloides nanus TaxID=290746 RepID=A0A914CM26_9BILA